MSEDFLPRRWNEIAPLLDAALEREPGDRPAFLDQACNGDTVLRAELEGLVADCMRSDRLFESGAVERFAALLTETPPVLPELMAGRYRVGREIGAGGMATVYLARDFKHDRDVALKVLRADLSAIIGSERFLAEVRITAKLDHPHILTLIDSGETDGLLFYVLPYVRGETLRAKLERERQLSIEDALSIARKVASALDYAHAQGVVHRDVKPENILLHEGEAVLADFGIALAVKEAGGNRLTQTGISLGTPQYMSPEQATGGRTLDARSDIYSLAAVLYEMIAGEPPVTGPTALAVIAKLLTERPTRLRIVRDTVPDGVDRAVDRALSKVPADRFATAGAFARALESAVTTTAGSPPRRRSSGTILAVIGGAAVVAIGAWFARGRSSPGLGVGAALRERTQITVTGHVASPAISGDGKTLAYRTTNCSPNGCTFGIELQDVGSAAASRRLFDGASAIYEIEWSPDRRNVIFHGTIKPRFGTYMVNALGGTPRRVGFNATFYAGGDSLLSWVATPGAGDTWVLVSGLDGVPHDSIHVGGPLAKLHFFKAIPGSNRIVVGLAEGPVLESRVIERDGRVASQTMLGKLGANMGVEAHASSDALWVSTYKSILTSANRSVIRIALDGASGRFSSSVDTLHAGAYTAFSVTADGNFLVLDEGTTEFGAWALDMSEAVHGVFPEQKRLLRSTSEIAVFWLSPDGERVLVARDVGSAGDIRRRWSMIPFGGGSETPLVAAQNKWVLWSDSATVAIRERTAAGIRLALLDVATGVVREPVVVADTVAGAFAHVPSGGWVWVTGDQHALRVQLPSESSARQIALPAWYLYTSTLDASPDGRFVAFSGYKSPDEDSIGVSVISLADGAITPWFTAFGEGGRVRRLNDGTFFLQLHVTPEMSTLYQLLGPGRAVNLGSIPGSVSSVSVSEDLKRIAIVVRDYHGDAWMSRVVRR